MELIKSHIQEQLEHIDPGTLSEADVARYFSVINTTLTPEQEQRVRTPATTYPRQHNVLAVHWHPEFVPVPLIRERIEQTFPQKREELIIPTQHNVLLNYDGYAGVEVDCYSRGFNQKVQLLLHFPSQNVAEAPVLKAMLEHTFQYRSSQLFDFLYTLTKPQEKRLHKAAKATGADEDLVRFTQAYARKIQRMLEEYYEQTPPEAIKNKLIRNYFDLLREEYGDPLIERAQTFLKAVKNEVKAHFSLRYFYRTSEIIEEARALGAGIVIPHPEQFWPILLAEYDVDGYEVWNPQSQRYTDFLISVVNRKNKVLSASQRPLLIFMGDDTHMGEKVKAPGERKEEKAEREIGVQPAWEDLLISKTLVKACAGREAVIRAYKQRLDTSNTARQY